MIDLGRIGLWSHELRSGEIGQAREAAAEAEELGYGAFWISGGSGGALERARELLGATKRAVVATGILSVWTNDAATVAEAHHQLNADFPERFLLGLGISHAPMVDRNEPGRYRKPIAKMNEYLDELDAAPHPVPKSERVLAAMAPKSLQMARERSAGVHPYLVGPELTRFAREHLGSGPIIAPEQTVILESDPERARAGARNFLANPYINFPNYRNSWFRQGYTEADLEDGGSDRWVDGIVAWGDAEHAASRIREHHDAGADHVCIQVLSSDGTRGEGFPVDAWRAIAGALAA